MIRLLTERLFSVTLLLSIAGAVHSQPKSLDFYMQINRLKVQRVARLVLASALILSSLLAPLTVGPQAALAQASAAGIGKIVVVGAGGATR